MHDQVEKSLMT